MRGALLALVLLAACGDDELTLPADAAVCPLTGPRCASAATLERCDGTRVVSEACAPGVCLAAGDGAACRVDGAACGGIDDLGYCVGEVAVRCAGGSLDVLACAAAGDSCVFNSGGAVCLDACAAAGVTAAGVCVGGDIARCSGTPPMVVVEDCLPGTVCSEGASGAECVSAAPCAGVGPAGRCDGDDLVVCVGGSPTTTPCASSGGVCGYDAAGASYVCGSAAALGPSVVSGRVEYEDRPPLLDGLGEAVRAPVRSAAVNLVADSGGAVLATAVTSDDGSYTLRHAAAAATLVHVTVAASSPLPLRPVEVRRSSGVIHGQISASFAAAATATIDVLATQTLATAEAFNVLDQLVVGVNGVVAALGVTPVAVTAIWQVGSTDGTYYWQNELHLLGGSSDDDGNDDAVILHEFGHHVEDAYGRTDTPGGYHDGSPTNPRLAWSEGFATFTSCGLRANRYYMDSMGSSGWSMDLEATVTPANPAGAMTQPLSEFTIGEILWDIVDAPASDDDDLAFTFGEVLAVQWTYLREILSGRGVSGVDLVDFLDGWLVLEGTGSCTGLRDIVTTDHRFPYDFAPPSAACP